MGKSHVAESDDPKPDFFGWGSVDSRFLIAHDGEAVFLRRCSGRHRAMHSQNLSICTAELRRFYSPHFSNASGKLERFVTNPARYGSISGTLLIRARFSGASKREKITRAILPRGTLFSP